MRIPLRFMIVVAWLAATLPVLAQVRVSITVGPPPLPIYAQPLIPGDGYLWMPGYWAWDDFVGGYYWVPGTWVLPPRVGLLWTPGYWRWDGPSFVFVDGYWGPVVGFYGGINYGFGYPGRGYYGGRWTGDRFFYNRSVTNVNVTVIRNTYVENVRSGGSSNRVSFNGGRDGVVARPTDRETAAARERQVPATEVQVQHAQRARELPDLHAEKNNGRPRVLATARPEALRDEAGGQGGEASRDRDQSSNPRDTERPQARPQRQQAQPERQQAQPERQQAQPERPQARPRPAPPQTRSEQPSAGARRPSPESGRPDNSAPTARPADEAQPPSAPGRAQSRQDRASDEQEQAPRTRQGKRRGK